MNVTQWQAWKIEHCIHVCAVGVISAKNVVIMYPEYRNQRQINIPPVIIVLFFVFGLMAILILPVMLIDEYAKLPESTESALYYDPTKEHANQKKITESANESRTDWMTPYPSGYLLTPENLSAVLSGTPAKITSTPGANTNAIVITDIPDPSHTQTPVPSATPSPTITPTPTDNPIFQTSTAGVEQAKVTLEVGELVDEAHKQASFNDWKRLFWKVFFTLFAIVIFLIAFPRILKEWRLYKIAIDNQEKIKEIKTSPWLAYPENTRYEVECVYKLILASIAYHQKEKNELSESFRIPGFRDAPGFEKKSNQWTDTTDYLHNRGYIIKRQGIKTLLKDYNVWQMKLIIEQGLYSDRNAAEKLVNSPPPVTEIQQKG